MPAAQSVHWLRLASAGASPKEPSGQMLHPAVSFVAPAVAPNLPLAHAVQLVIAVIPVAELQRPEGQANWKAGEGQYEPAAQGAGESEPTGQ